MANIAVVFHWPPSEMNPMDINELLMWHKKAEERSTMDQEEKK